MEPLINNIQPPAKAFALIIGAGPVGLFTALSLARYGLPSVVVERQVTRSGQPKSHALNPRTMEILRQVGISTSEIRALGNARTDGDVVRWVESLVGIEYGNFEYECQGDDVKHITPEPFMNIAQPKLEDALADIARESGLISIYRGWQWQSCNKAEEDDRIRSDVIKLADGSSIMIEKIPSSPFPSEMTYVSVEIRADWTKYKSGMLWILTTANDIKTFIVYDRASCWVFMFAVGSDEALEKYTEEHCRSLIDKGVGEKTDYEIAKIVLWKAHLRIASNYRSKKYPKAFLLGDAAHAFPNAGGLGLNTGFADVHNLAWKIYAVKSGWTNSQDHLLDTYSSERKPIAESNLKQSDRNQFDVITVSNAISTLLRGNPAQHYYEGANMQEIDSILERNAHLKDHLNLQIGYVYGSSEDLPANARYFKPRCVAGGRLPHSWITRGQETISTLDLVTGRSFVVIAGPDYPALPTSLARVGGAVIELVQANRDFHDHEGSWSRVMEIEHEDALVVVRPDQHILGRAPTLTDIIGLVAGYLSG